MALILRTLDGTYALRGPAGIDLDSVFASSPLATRGLDGDGTACVPSA